MPQPTSRICEDGFTSATFERTSTRNLALPAKSCTPPVYLWAFGGSPISRRPSNRSARSVGTKYIVRRIQRNRRGNLGSRRLLNQACRSSRILKRSTAETLRSSGCLMAVAGCRRTPLRVSLIILVGTGYVHAGSFGDGGNPRVPGFVHRLAIHTRKGLGPEGHGSRRVCVMWPTVLDVWFMRIPKGRGCAGHCGRNSGGKEVARKAAAADTAGPASATDPTAADRSRCPPHAAQTAALSHFRECIEGACDVR